MLRCFIPLATTASLSTLLATNDPGLLIGSAPSAMEIRWQPEVASNPLPKWAPGPIETTAAGATLPIPPAHFANSSDSYLLTVVFYDTNDSGPTVDWIFPDQSALRLSEGLGESPEPLGLHCRSLLIPPSLAKTGGRISISMPWRQSGLVKAVVEPARTTTVATIPPTLNPAIIDRSGNARDRQDVNGLPPSPLTGDVRHGRLIEAELSATIEPLNDILEFHIPVDAEIESAALHCEILGLDLEARIFVFLNDISLGELNTSPPRLDDPSLAPDASGRIRPAGWRKFGLFLPAFAWKVGTNSLLLRLRSPRLSVSHPVFIKNSSIQIVFSPPHNTTPPLKSLEFLPPLNLATHAPTSPAQITPIPQPPSFPAINIPPPQPTPTASPKTQFNTR